MSAETTLHTFSNDEFEMDYFCFGSGSKAFVMLPGLSLTSVMLIRSAVAAAYADFAKDFTVYVFDRRKNIDEGYSIKDMADDTATAMKSIGIKDACVFGASQGGMIAQCIAIKYPQLVSKLVLCATMAKYNNTSKKVLGDWAEIAKTMDVQMLNLTVYKYVFSDEYYSKHQKEFELIAKLGTHNDMQRFNILAKACLDFDVYNELDKIKCPVFVIGTNADKVLSGEASVEIAKKLNCELLMYENYGHAVYDEAPNCKSEILRFCLK